MAWNYLCIPKLQRLRPWSLGLYNRFHTTPYIGCRCLSMLGSKLIHVSNRSSLSLGFVIMNINCQRTIAKKLRHMIDIIKPNVINRKEYWLKPNITSSQVFRLEDFQVTWNDRTNWKGGGVFIMETEAWVHSPSPGQNGCHFCRRHFWIAFYWMKMIEFRFQFHWNGFPGVQLTRSQHLFR